MGNVGLFQVRLFLACILRKLAAIASMLVISSAVLAAEVSSPDLPALKTEF